MTTSVDPAAVLTTVLPGDTSTLDATRAGVVLGHIKTIRSYLDAYEARLTTHITRLHAAGHSAPAADLHTRDGGITSREARQKERRAETLEAAPAIADALTNGDITAAHADALAGTTSRLDDDTRRELFDHQADLAADAARMTPEQFARTCRDLIRRIERDQGIERDRRQRRDTRLTKRIERDGMYTLTARMHPELGHAVFTAIDAETAARIIAGGDRTADRQRIAAEALGGLVSGGHQAIRPREAEIRIHIDARTLIDAPHRHSTCEYDDGTPLPPPSVRRLVCNGRIVPIIIDTNGVVLDAGRDQRLANRHQRRALRAMYRTCAFFGCDTPFNQCEIHHLDPYELGGRTDLARLLPLCSRHHHVIHEPGWELHLDRDRTLTIRHLGEIHAVVPLRRSSAGTSVVTPAGGGGAADPPPEHPVRPPAPPPRQLALVP